MSFSYLAGKRGSHRPFAVVHLIQQRANHIRSNTAIHQSILLVELASIKEGHLDWQIKIHASHAVGCPLTTAMSKIKVVLCYNECADEALHKTFKTQLPKQWLGAKSDKLRDVSLFACDLS